ncbi:hypothetical protein ACQPZX_38820 [Actinoplanes sp. CA-142083]|uniref:hypothetical protein n=1 Tax=Actinoplanes sp. CA-142083 TaxID=3239903 RepID=UPI003D9443ED
MTVVRRRVMMSGLLAAFLTLAAGLLNLVLSQGWLWVLVFAAVCYPAVRAFGREREGAPKGPAGEGAAKEPWRPELVAAGVSLVAVLLLVPFVPSGLAAYTIAAAVVLAVYASSAWWFGRRA